MDNAIYYIIGYERLYRIVKEIWLDSQRLIKNYSPYSPAYTLHR